MKIIAIDDERPALNILVRAISEAAPDAEIMRFERTDALLTALRERTILPDVAFLDIEMPNMNGLELAKLVKDLCPDVNIIFVTGFSRYALDAIAVRPSGYMMKPATVNKVLAELHNLRNIPLDTTPSQRQRVQCFGEFEVFFNGAPLHFTHDNAKALFACLIDRKGATITAEEIAALLWGRNPDGTVPGDSFREAISNLTQSLKDADAPDVLIRDGQTLAVRTDALDCDYYDFLNGDVAAINRYTGQYMAQYGWARMTVSPMAHQAADSSPRA